MRPPTSDLATLLKHASPKLHARPVAIVSCGDCISDEWLRRAIGMFREDEGLTLYIDLEAAEQAGLSVEMRAAQITMTIESALEAIGFTAAFATALAQEGVACNVVAGARHDHLFVPWERRKDAMRVLQSLSDLVTTGRS